MDAEKEEGMTHGLLVEISGQQVGDKKEEEQKRMAKETLRGRAFHISLSQKSEGNDYGSRFQGEGG